MHSPNVKFQGNCNIHICQSCLKHLHVGLFFSNRAPYFRFPNSPKFPKKQTCECNLK